MTKYEEQFYHDITMIKMQLTKIAEELKRLNDLKQINKEDKKDD